MKEVRYVWWGQVMECFEGDEEYFEVYSLFYGKPVELLEDGGDVVGGGGPCDDAGCRVLEELQFLEGFVGETKEK